MAQQTSPETKHRVAERPAIKKLRRWRAWDGNRRSGPFGHRRKTPRNALSGIADEPVLRASGIDTGARRIACGRGPCGLRTPKNSFR